MNDMEKIEMAYVAGLIDGDGSINFSKTRSRGRVVYHPVVQLHNSIKEMPFYLKDKFGGTLAIDKPKKEGYRPVHKWMLQGYVGCLNVLKKITPYLVTKKEPAIKLLNFLTTQVPEKGKFFSYNQEVKEAESIYLLMKTYMRKRKSDLSIMQKASNKCTENKEFWAYIAGLIETDGSLSVMRSVRKPSEKNRQVSDYIQYRPCIQLTMVTGDNLNHILSNTCLGKVYTIKAKSTLKGVAYKLNIKTKNEVYEFLNRIFPYLNFKKKQAEILLKFCEKYTPAINSRKMIPDEEKKFRDYCHDEIIRLNNTPS